MQYYVDLWYWDSPDQVAAVINALFGVPNFKESSYSNTEVVQKLFRNSLWSKILMQGVHTCTGHSHTHVYFSAQGMPTQTYSIWNFGACVPSYAMSHLRWK